MCVLFSCMCICTHSCAANSRLIFATCSFSSMSLSPWSPLSFLLVGLMGGGPVLWLEEEDEEDDDEDEEEDDRDRSLGSPLKAASPEEEKHRGRKKRQDRGLLVLLTPCSKTWSFRSLNEFEIAPLLHKLWKKKTSGETQYSIRRMCLRTFAKHLLAALLSFSKMRLEWQLCSCCHLTWLALLRLL